MSVATTRTAGHAEKRAVMAIWTSKRQRTLQLRKVVYQAIGPYQSDDAVAPPMFAMQTTQALAITGIMLLRRSSQRPTFFAFAGATAGRAATSAHLSG